VSRIAFTGSVRQREPRVRDKPYLGFIAKQYCVACYCRGGFQTWPVEVAHIKVGFPEAGWRPFGHGERGHDRHCTPLCAVCHRTGPRAQHANLGGDERHFWADMGVYPPDFCAALGEAYEAGDSGINVIRRASQGAYPFPA
jgi:hypothetical protein